MVKAQISLSGVQESLHYFLVNYLNLMPRLHLLRSSHDLFVYDFPYDFFGILAAISYDVCVYIAYDQLTISLATN